MTTDSILYEDVASLKTNVPNTIPLIDFSKFTDPTTRNELGKELVDAFHTCGFVYLKNHGIPKELSSKMFSLTKSFFELPLDKKMELVWETAESNRCGTHSNIQRLPSSRNRKEFPVRQDWKVGRDQKASRVESGYEGEL
jgi:isopenicillin N synthase-like dioxygenase